MAHHLSQKSRPSVAVIGVGGAGNHVLNSLISAGLSEAEFIAVDADLDTLNASRAPNCLCLREALPADPTLTAQLAELIAQTEIVFIIAGMGGATGTSASPAIASLARTLGAHTIGVVSSPFYFEGTTRRRYAEEGIKDLRAVLDTLIAQPNQRLLAKSGASATMKEVFAMSVQTLQTAVTDTHSTL